MTAAPPPWFASGCYCRGIEPWRSRSFGLSCAAKQMFFPSAWQWENCQRVSCSGNLHTALDLNLFTNLINYICQTLGLKACHWWSPATTVLSEQFRSQESVYTVARISCLWRASVTPVFLFFYIFTQTQPGNFCVGFQILGSASSTLSPSEDERDIEEDAEDEDTLGEEEDDDGKGAKAADERSENKEDEKTMTEAGGSGDVEEQSGENETAKKTAGEHSADHESEDVAKDLGQASRLDKVRIFLWFVCVGVRVCACVLVHARACVRVCVCVCVPAACVRACACHYWSQAWSVQFSFKAIFQDRNRACQYAVLK